MTSLQAAIKEALYAKPPGAIPSRPTRVAAAVVEYLNTPAVIEAMRVEFIADYYSQPSEGDEIRRAQHAMRAAVAALGEADKP